MKILQKMKYTCGQIINDDKVLIFVFVLMWIMQFSLLFLIHRTFGVVLIYIYIVFMVFSILNEVGVMKITL